MQVGDDKEALLRPIKRAGDIGDEPDPGDGNLAWGSIRLHGRYPVVPAEP
jgi:hypothetical protein